MDVHSCAGSSSTELKDNQHWDGDRDNSKPAIQFGGDKVAQELISDLLKPGRDNKRYLLWGMGGAGKTFTARIIYNDDRVRKHFTGGIFWVPISAHWGVGRPPCHLLLKTLFELTGGVGKFPDSLEDARALLKNFLDRDKVLLVLDGAWDLDTVRDLDLMPDGRGCVMLVTARDRNVLGPVDLVEIFQIPPLSQEDSWSLFSWHAFLDHGKEVPPELVDVARDVANECGGLPLALEIVGSAMADIQLPDCEVGQLRESRIQECKQKWQDAVQKLSMGGLDEYGTLYRRLHFSVDNLKKSGSRLLECFLYVAALPKSYTVDIELLLSIWVAEGIAENAQETLISSEDGGKALLALLASKSMIELIEHPGKHINLCKIHSVMRNVALQNVQAGFGGRFHDVQPTERTRLFAPALQLQEFPQDWLTSATQCSAERVSLCSDYLEQLPDQFNAPNLRVLILSKSINLRALSSSFFRSLPSLRVLDLSETGVEEISGAVLQSLKSLVLLNLKGCNALKTISDEIKHLQNLQFVMLDRCCNLQKLPSMKSLTKLHTLSLLREVQYSVRGTRNLFRAKRIHDIHQVLQLRSLKRLSIDMYGRDQPSADISSLTSLQELKMKGVKSFPQGISKLTNLRTLQVLSFHGRSIPELEKLPLLEDLEIRVEGESRVVTFSETFGHRATFPSLKRMSLSGLSEVENFTFHRGAMPKIERLKVLFCDRGKGYLSKTLTVLGCSLKLLQLAGCEDKSLRLLFSDPGKFPFLEHLVFGQEERPPSTVRSLPKLRRLEPDFDESERPRKVARRGAGWDGERNRSTYIPY